MVDTAVIDATALVVDEHQEHARTHTHTPAHTHIAVVLQLS